MDYKEMLKKVRAQLPEQVFKKERFEIPKLDSQIVGNRTFVRNFVDAANAVRRETEHMLKYMAKELASSGGIEGKTAIFQGKFSDSAVNNKFQKYVEMYVLCAECGKPDTKVLKEDRLSFVRCEACGAKRAVPRIK